MDDYCVLIVDDEIDFLDSLVRRLNRREVAAAGASSGNQALAMLEHRPADVVVLDVKMPGMDGLAALKIIKERWPATEVILLTGHASVESGMEGLNLGAFDYLIKPVKLDLLIERVLEARERGRVVREMRIN